MSAGSGIRHAEYNAEGDTTRIFQIWIVPEARGGEPTWGSRPFPKGDRHGRFVVLASGRKGDGDALPIRADARVLGATLRAGESATYALEPGRHAYLVPARGSVEIEERGHGWPLADSTELLSRARTKSDTEWAPKDGRAKAARVRLDARDGAAVRDVETVTVKALSDAEVVLVDSR